MENMRLCTIMSAFLRASIVVLETASDMLEVMVVGVKGFVFGRSPDGSLKD